MNQHQQQPLDSGQEPAMPQVAATAASRLEARRRLLKGGLALAPVAMTVTIRPVLGSNLECHGPTGFQSANVSRAVGKTVDAACGTRKRPADWAVAGTPYPTGFTSGTVFASYFPNSGFTTGTTFGGVLTMAVGGSVRIQIAQLVVAAILNSVTTTVPSRAQIIALWNGHVNKNYSPSGESPWDDAKIIKYLNYTMGVVVSF